MNMHHPSASSPALESHHVFERAAELFGLLSSPLRLRIVSELCRGEQNVSGLLERIDTTQPNLSQHLSTLYRAGVLARRREGAQIHYRIANERVASLCRAVCTDIAISDASTGTLDQPPRHPVAAPASGKQRAA
jgi:ArsR family transcriptional regulator